MKTFNYAKQFIITDKQARDLRLTIELPMVYLYQNKLGQIYLTASCISMHNIYYVDMFDCTLTKDNWIIDMLFPFPWENNYRFIRKQRGIYQLMNKEIKGKEQITYVRPEIKTLPTTRCRKAKAIQSMCQPEPTSYRKDPNLFDTLQ